MKKNAANDFIKGKGTMADLKPHMECYEKLGLRFSSFFYFHNPCLL